MPQDIDPHFSRSFMIDELVDWFAMDLQQTFSEHQDLQDHLLHVFKTHIDSFGNESLCSMYDDHIDGI